MEKSLGARLDLTVFNVTIQIKATEQYLPVVLFIMLQKRIKPLFIVSMNARGGLLNEILPWAILSFFSDSPTSCSLERWRWTTLKKSQTLLWEQIKRLETLSLQTIILAPREVHRLVLKKTSKVKKSKKQKSRPTRAWSNFFMSVLSVGKLPGDGGCSQVEVQGGSLLRSTKLTGSVNMVYKN